MKPLKGDCADAFMSSMGTAAHRNAPTTPPPPAMVEASELENRASDLERFAQRILDRSSELRRAASAKRGAR